MTVYFTADSHFGHGGIIASCSRPFASAEAMDREMIDRWNATVRPTDTVYHLGDFGFGGIDDMHRIFKRLNGKKHLIAGNHDGAATRNLDWRSVAENAKLGIDGKRLYLSHYPHVEWPKFHGDAIHLFGHVHGQKAGVPGSCDVGVDVWHFRPVRLDEILAKLEAPVRNRPADFLGRLPGRTLQLLDRIEREWPAWSRDAIAQAAERAINAEIDRVLAQVVAQGGFQDGEDDKD